MWRGKLWGWEEEVLGLGGGELWGWEEENSCIGKASSEVGGCSGVGRRTLLGWEGRL